MSALDRALRAVEPLLKGRLHINPGLDAVERTRAYKRTQAAVLNALKKQTSDLLRSDLFKDINTAIGKAERIDTESDELEIEDAVIANLTPLEDYLGDAFADFLILVFNMGGQDFLNKHNIPATFELTNETIITNVQRTSQVVLSGVDETTAQWVADQISVGRVEGLSNAEIADQIREAVPKTYDGRAERIVRTETSRMVGQSEAVAATKNGASHKYWVTVGGACDLCTTNEEQGTIGVDQLFASGDPQEPAHPNCRCLVEYEFTPFQGAIWHGQ